MSEWYAATPTTWKRGRVKSIARRVTDGAHISPDTEGGVYDFVSTRDVKSGQIDFASALKTTPDSYAYMVKTGCKPVPGDVLFSKDGTVGETVVIREDREFAVASSLVIVSPRPDVMDSTFLAYVFTAKTSRDQAVSMMRGAGLPRLSVGNLARMEVPVPPLAEQRAIADYLDRETAQIDTLIAKQEQLIATLRERRDGLIERALVCGLNRAVGLRAAAIPWLAGASVPSHWDATRVKHLALAMRAGEGITADNIEETGPYRVFGGNGLRGYATAYTHNGTFVLIGRQGALCGNVHLVHGEFWASEHAIVVTPREGVDVGWLAHMLRLMNLGRYSMTTAQPGIGVGQIAPLMVPLPPLDEQREIATHIDKQTAKIDVLIDKTEQFIELSKERRSALITAAVTGQIDVRASA
ncbi:restriction endonuclease subunit S [Nocardioides sp. R1-1]|uniref:restriction endonuclease subunit S n=1 Tax=Nocardioides sp. R1-1 TaxID=3383502 RepID=UPI0038CFDDE7